MSSAKVLKAKQLSVLLIPRRIASQTRTDGENLPQLRGRAFDNYYNQTTLSTLQKSYCATIKNKVHCIVMGISTSEKYQDYNHGKTKFFSMRSWDFLVQYIVSLLHDTLHIREATEP